MKTRLITTALLAECREERATDRADPRRDCREDRREDASEFRAEYGTGTPAFMRCVKDELR
jgi:hypothetical protein